MKDRTKPHTESPDELPHDPLSSTPNDERLHDPLSSTPYDDVFQTLVNDHPALVLPLLNEMFGENYAGDESILHRPTVHYLDRGKGAQAKRITDSSFTVFGGSTNSRSRHYHLECESRIPGDNRILIRIFEYDAQIALDQGSMLAGRRLSVRFPHTGILFLRSRDTTDSTMTIAICTPGGDVSYDIPVLKIRDYSWMNSSTGTSCSSCPFTSLSMMENSGRSIATRDGSKLCSRNT